LSAKSKVTTFGEGALNCFRPWSLKTLIRPNCRNSGCWNSGMHPAVSEYRQPSLGSNGLPLQIDSDTVTASDHVRVLGVTFSADLSLDKHVSSTAARASTTVDCRRFYMPTCTGSMWQIGSGTSLALQSTDVSATKRPSIWSTAAFQSQTSPVVSDYVPHVVVCCRYHTIDVAHSAVGHSQSSSTSISVLQRIKGVTIMRYI